MRTNGTEWSTEEEEAKVRRERLVVRKKEAGNNPQNTSIRPATSHPYK